MMIHNWSNHLDDGSEVCSVFIDVRKAFDSVPHCHLLNKLSKLQLDPHILHWIHSYLADQSQVVAFSCVFNLLPRMLFLVYHKDQVLVLYSLSSMLMLLYIKSHRQVTSHYMQMIPLHSLSH